MYDDRQQQCYPSKYKFCNRRKIEICSGDIVKVIRSLDPNKAHGHDEISICI